MDVERYQFKGQETRPPAPGLLPIDERLRFHKDAVIEIWKQRVRDRIPASRAQTSMHLKDSLPQFIDCLASALSGDQPCPTNFTDTADASKEHGRQRANLGDYGIDEMLSEYRILREVIIEVLERDHPLNSRERDIILFAIEDGMTTATAHYSKFVRQKEKDVKGDLSFERYKLETIFNKSPSAMAFWRGKNFIFEMVNPMYQAIFPDRELLGKPFLEALPEFKDQGFIDLLTQVFETGEPFVGHEVLARHRRRKDGPIEDVYYDFTYVRINDRNGKPYGVYDHAIDVTDRVLDRRRREESEARYREAQDHLNLALESAKMGTWFIDSRSKVGTASPALAALYGVDEVHGDIAEIISKRVHPEDASGLVRAITHAIEKKAPLEHEFRIIRADGEMRWHLIRGRIMLDQGGNSHRLYGVQADITERKQAEEAAIRTKQDLERFFMQSPTPMVIVTGPEHRFALANPPYEKLVGRKVMGKTVRESFTDSEIGHFIPILDRVYHKGEPFIGREMPLNVPDETGKTKNLFVNLAYHPFRDEKGNIQGILADVQDVTEQVRARKAIEENESRFRQIANALPLMVWTARPDGFVDWYNEWWYEYTGATRGSHWDDETSPMHPDDIEPTRKRWRHSLETGEPYQMEYRFKRQADGEYRWHLGRASSIKDASGKITKWIGSNTDIHDQKQITQKLQEEKELRERFVATLTHDLRSPLTAARMSAELAGRRANGNPAIQKLLNRIFDNIDRADHMIRDLLDANRINAGGKLPIEVNECDLINIATHTIEDLSTIHGDRFVLRGPSELKGFWSCSGVRRILENLCNNAIKYGIPHRPITITISRRGEMAQIDIHNEGQPISREDQISLFEPFRRTKSAQIGGQKGWGLGLTLVKGIAEAHGGQAKVRSEPGDGTIFTILLPVDARPFTLEG